MEKISTVVRKYFLGCLWTINFIAGKMQKFNVKPDLHYFQWFSSRLFKGEMCQIDSWILAITVYLDINLMNIIR